MQFRQLSPENEPLEVFMVLRVHVMLMLSHIRDALSCFGEAATPPESSGSSGSSGIFDSLRVFPRGDLVDGQPRA